MSDAALRWGLVVLVAVTFVTSASLLVGVARQASEIGGYVEVPGEVVSARLEVVDEAADLWRPVAIVRYRVGGLEFMASSEATLRKRPRAEADAWITAHPVGAALPVFHEPGSPGAARLTRDVSILQPVVAFFVTLTALFLAVRWALRGRRRRGVETNATVA